MKKHLGVQMAPSILTTVIMTVTTTAALAQAEIRPAVIQTATKVYYCKVTKEYADSRRPDAELYLKLIRISDGAILTDQPIATFDSAIGGGGPQLQQCQTKAISLNSMSQ